MFLCCACVPPPSWKAVLPAPCRTSFLQFSSHLTFQQLTCQILLSALPASPATISPSSSTSPIITIPAICPITGLFSRFYTRHVTQGGGCGLDSVIQLIGVWSLLRHIRYFEYLLAPGRFDTSLVFLQSNRCQRGCSEVSSMALDSCHGQLNLVSFTYPVQCSLAL